MHDDVTEGDADDLPTPRAADQVFENVAEIVANGSFVAKEGN